MQLVCFGKCRKDDQQLGWRLRLVSLVHGDFGDEIGLAFVICDMPIDVTGSMASGQVLPKR